MSVLRFPVRWPRWPRRGTAGPVLAAAVLASLALAGGASASTGVAAAAGPCISATGLQPPSPGNQTGFSGVSMRNGCDAWAVGTTITAGGDTAVIEHFDGSGWSVTENPDVAGVHNTGLRAVAAVAADNAWAVGSAGAGSLIEHWDGTGWHRVSSPADEPAGSSLAAIWAVSPSNIWAVGDTRTDTSGGDRTLIEHYDGSSWTVSQNVPSPGRASGLQGVTATSATDAWAVGSTSDGLLIEHWNGSAWTVTPAPTPLAGVLTGVAATTPGNAWAVGWSPHGLGFAPVMLRWNGRAWSPFTALPPGGSRLLALTTTSDTPGINRNIWAVGDTTSGSALAWRWDGSSWAAIPAPALGTTSALRSVTASSVGSVWLAGYSITGGAQAPIAISAAGAPASACVGMAGQQPPGDGLTGVAVLSPCSIWVGGHGITHWDGATWTSSPLPDVPADSRFLDLHALTASDIWAVGDTDDSATQSEKTLIEHWDGTSWKVSPEPHPADSNDVLSGVTATSPTNAWAVGLSVLKGPDGARSSLIEHWNGTAWTRLTVVPTSGDALGLGDVAASSPANAWAVGVTLTGDPSVKLHGLILHWDGRSWSEVSIPANTGGLVGVTVVSANDAWAVGSNGLGPSRTPVILHWDGSSWQPAPTPTGVTGGLDAVTATSASDVWAVGNRGTGTSLVEHWDGAAWTVIPTPAGQISLGRVAARTGSVWAVGQDTDSRQGIALRLRVG